MPHLDGNQTDGNLSFGFRWNKLSIYHLGGAVLAMMYETL